MLVDADFKKLNWGTVGVVEWNPICDFKVTLTMAAVILAHPKVNTTSQVYPNTWGTKISVKSI